MRPGTAVEAHPLPTAQGKMLFIARLKMPAYEALTRAALPGLEPDRLGDLSVDDVVRAAALRMSGNRRSGVWWMLAVEPVPAHTLQNR